MSKKYTRKFKEPKHVLAYETPTEEILERHRVAPLQAQTQNQERYLASIHHNRITFGLGVAGTGKSYCSAGYAADMLRNKQICRIVLTRPAVDCDEDLGALPGELDEKFAPYIEPFKDILIERLGKSATEYYIKRKQIDIRPLSFMRGSTFKGDGSKGVIVILDEAQNTTKNQMKMFLSRIGSNCKLLINGDMEQSDIRGTSGLQDAVNRLEGIPSIGMVEFDEDDIVRDPMCKAIILAYRHAG